MLFTFFLFFKRQSVIKLWLKKLKNDHLLEKYCHLLKKMTKSVAFKKKKCHICITFIVSLV